jgi:hypothetical protein
MIDLILDVLGMIRPKSWGRTVDYLNDVDRTPSSSDVNQDYFRRNAPSADKKASENFYGRGYRPNQYEDELCQEVASQFSGFSMLIGFVILAAIIIVLMYCFVPNFQIPFLNQLLHR